jgi:hypothetical protein
MGIQGMKTLSSLYFPVKIIASSRCDVRFIKTKRVPLHNFGNLRFLKTPYFWVLIPKIYKN